MSSRASPRTPRPPREKATRSSTREQKSPVSMKPSRDRAKRSEALIEEQVCPCVWKHFPCTLVVVCSKVRSPC